jgi:hypothetical protein
MLQLVQTKVRHGGGFQVVVHRHHAAFVFEFVATLHTAQDLFSWQGCAAPVVRGSAR